MNRVNGDSVLNMKASEFETVKSLINFELYDNFLLANVDNYDKVDLLISAN